MLKKYKISGSWVINVLVAMLISLMLNFSYFVFFIMINRSSFPQPPHMRAHPMNDSFFISLEFLYYFVLALLLIIIFTFRVKNYGDNEYSLWRRILLATAVVVTAYFVSPTVEPRHGLSILAFSSRKFEPMAMLKSSFTLVVTALYGKIYQLLYQRQNIILEMEKLKNENLQSQYNVLINQINPHFFFNSLNSLAMLVREGKIKPAILYIDHISDTFRYIIQNGQNLTTTLKQELEFLENYKFLFEIRYEGKLFFNIDIQDEQMLECTLLPLSLQPLIENAVKHNTITLSKPLIITITTESGYLVVSNPIVPKLDETPPGTGIGLSNLSHRYILLMGKDIRIESGDGVFKVSLPLKD